MRTVIMIMIGLVGGFIIGIVLADIGFQLFGRAGAAVISPYAVAVAGAIGAPIVDALFRHRST